MDSLPAVGREGLRWIPFWHWMGYGGFPAGRGSEGVKVNSLKAVEGKGLRWIPYWKWE